MDMTQIEKNLIISIIILQADLEHKDFKHQDGSQKYMIHCFNNVLTQAVISIHLNISQVIY